MAHPLDIERASDIHMEWLQQLADRMGVATTHQSGPQLRAVMHELRRVLCAEHVLVVANALPTLDRGIFLDGWSLDERPVRLENADVFAERVYERVKAHHFRVPSLVSDVFWLWQTKLPERDAQTIRSCLPAELEPLWPKSLQQSGSD